MIDQSARSGGNEPFGFGFREHGLIPKRNEIVFCQSPAGLPIHSSFVVESQGAKKGELRLLYQPFAVIGRDPRADIVLDHTRVSRRHVYLQIVNGRAFWVDLESRSGTQG